MEMSATKTQTPRTTHEKLRKDVLSGALLRQIVRPCTRSTETRNVSATRDVHPGVDVDLETAPMTSASLPHSSTVSLRRRWGVERSCASQGGSR